MKDAAEINNKIKKIIDPKSGFSLYLRQFKDSSILQVSTDKEFSIPNDLLPNEHSLENHDIKTKLSDIESNQENLNQHTQQAFKALEKNNQQLQYIIYAVIILFLASILF